MGYVFYVVGIVFIVLSIAMVLSNSQAFRRFAVLELMLILITVGCGSIGFKQAKDTSTRLYLDFYSVYYAKLHGFVSNLEKQDASEIDWVDEKNNLSIELVNALPIVTENEDVYRYAKAVVLQREEGNRYYETVYLSDKDITAFDENEYILADTLCKKALSDHDVAADVYDESRGMLAIVDDSRISPKYCVVTEISLTPLEADINALHEQYLLWGIIFLVGCTIILALVIYLQGVEMRKMLRIARRVAEGRADWDSLSVKEAGALVESNEVRTLKNTLRQISCEVAKMNYVKYRYLQAYYRFAPKKIETILDKPSILDVEPLDRVHTTGTMVYVSFMVSDSLEESEYIKKMNDNYELLCDANAQYDGITVACNNDMTVVQQLFMGETKKALGFGNEIIGRRMEEKGCKAFVLLHRTSFVYGVAGNDDQAYSYVLSKEMKVLEKYIERLKGMGIPMAATDSAYEVIEKGVESRYIGYIEDGNYVFKIYEILDAYSAKGRIARIETKSKFKKALNLFYQGDFYLARNLFTEVLKDCPSDEVAKWYLFLSEERLNENKADNISFSLF